MVDDQLISMIQAANLKLQCLLAERQQEADDRERLWAELRRPEEPPCPTT